MKVTVKNNLLYVTFQYSAQLVEEIKKTHVARWSPQNKQWTLKPTFDTIEFLIKHDAELDDSAKKLINSAITNLEQQKEINSLKKILSKATEAPPIEEIEKQLQQVTPYPFQWAPAHYAELAKGRFLLADSMGLGKSMQALMITLLDAFKDPPVMIICPKSVTGSWQLELQQRFGFKSKIITTPLTKLDPKIRYYICSYSQLSKIKKDLGFFWIIDEVHMLKNRSAVRTQTVKNLTKESPHLVSLTGTPIQNRPEELFQILQIVDPNFPMSWSAFMRRFCGAYWDGFGYNVRGASNMAELHDYIYNNYLIRREKESVLPDLPTKTRQVVQLGEKEIPAESMLELFSLNAQTKAIDSLFLNYIEDVITSTKAVLFYHHRVMGDALEELYKKFDLKYIRIDGQTPSELRTQYMAAFQADPEIQGAILSLKAAGTGITLTAASVMVMAELNWVPGDLLQAEDRILRIGQKNACLILYPLLSKFELELYELIIKKLCIIERIVGGGISDDVSDSSLMSVMSKKFGIPIKAASKEEVTV